LKPGRLIYSGGDVHIYQNHYDAVTEQLGRVPNPAPNLWVEPRSRIDQYEMGDFILEGYDPHPAIRAEMAV
jgi:thymidylate synthase